MPQSECYHPSTITQFSTAILFLFLLYASTKDMASKTIPIHLVPVCLLFTTIDLIMNQSPAGLLLRLIIAAGIFLLLCLISRFFGLGGGDIIVISIILLEHGLCFAMLAMGIGCILTTIYTVLRHIIKRSSPFSQDEECPLVPGITIAYTILLFAKELSIWHPIL